MRDVIAVLVSLDAPVPATPGGGLGSASVQVALIGGAVTLLAIYLSALVTRGAASRRRREAENYSDDPAPPTQALVDELRERAVRAETSESECVRERAQLREFVSALGYDPDTLRRRPGPRRREGGSS